MRPSRSIPAAAIVIAAVLPLATVTLGPGRSPTALLLAQATAARSIRVRETAGIRRTEYPVNARLSFAKAALKDAASIRLMTNGTEIATQVAAASAWEDGSVQALELDFNASLDPGEDRRYELQFGDGVVAAVKPARGLTVEELADAIQVGNVRFARSGSPLIASAAYRGEGIGPGANGITVTDAAGQRHDLTTATLAAMTVVKPGPFLVALRYTAMVPIDAGYSVPTELQIEMPNSKT
jgi:hypothetical protein